MNEWMKKEINKERKNEIFLLWKHTLSLVYMVNRKVIL